MIDARIFQHPGKDILAVKPDSDRVGAIVLAQLEGVYVTWHYNPEGNYFHTGHYYEKRFYEQDYEEALKDFEERR